MRRLLWLALVALAALLGCGNADADTVLSEDHTYEWTGLDVEGNLTVTDGAHITFLAGRLAFESPGAHFIVENGSTVDIWLGEVVFEAPGCNLTVAAGGTLILDDSNITANTSLTADIQGLLKVDYSDFHNLTRLTVAGSLVAEDTWFYDLATLNLTGTATIAEDSLLWDTTVTVEGELILRNATPCATLVLAGGSVELWNSSFDDTIYNGGALTEGHMLRISLQTPFSQPVTDANWSVVLPGHGWNRTGKTDALGLTPWIEAPTSRRNESGTFNDTTLTCFAGHDDYGWTGDTFNLTTNRMLRWKLEFDLRVNGFGVNGLDGDEVFFINEPFILNVLVENVGTSNFEVTGKLTVFDTVTIKPLKGSDKKDITSTEQIKLGLGEERVLALQTAGIPRPGTFLLYFRLYVEHTVVSPLNGTVEIMRGSESSVFHGPYTNETTGQPVKGEWLALIKPMEGVPPPPENETYEWANGYIIRAPLDGVANRVFVSSGTVVEAGTPLMRVQLDLSASSTNIEIQKRPEPPETFMGLEYRYWLGILPTMVLVGVGSIFYVREMRRLGSCRAEEVFLLDNIGRVIAHAGLDEEVGLDEDIIGSMLQALQDFVAESFQTDEGEPLRRLEHGNLLLIIERGKNCVLVLVVKGQERPEVRTQLKTFITDIEQTYSDVLEDWDGDSAHFVGSEELLGVIRDEVQWDASFMGILRSFRDRFRGRWSKALGQRVEEEGVVEVELPEDHEDEESPEAGGAPDEAAAGTGADDGTPPTPGKSMFDDLDDLKSLLSDEKDD